MSLRPVLILCLALSIAACASTRADGMKRDQALYTYQSTLRWGDFAGAMAFIQPDLREKLQPSAIELQRMQQLQVTGYYVKSKEQPSDTEIRQVVELRVVNKHTQVERSVIDRQVWVWDSKAGAWWLTTRLPDFAPR